VKHLARLVQGWRSGAGVALHVPLGSIRFKLLGRTVRALRAGDVAGDWDLDRRPIEETTKYISVVQHFRDGVPWENTPIFRRYAIRFSEGEVIRGCSSVHEFKAVYEADMDSLYRSVKERGFLSHEERELPKSDLPHIYIGRDGEIIFGSDGNHRLAIAHVLGLAEIPCRIIRRHDDWETLRRDALASQAGRADLRTNAALARHPDLQDVFSP
jgi:hypothetical protein